MASELEDAKKVTKGEIRVLEDTVSALQERIAQIEAHLGQDAAAYGGTPLTVEDEDYIEAEVTP